MHDDDDDDDRDDEMIAAIEAGVQAADRGDVLDFDDVKAELAAKLAALQAR